MKDGTVHDLHGSDARDGDAAHFRDRARHVRELAKTARDPSVLDLLLELAEDFEREARLLDPPNTQQP